MDFKIPKFDELKDRLGIGEASSQAGSRSSRARDSRDDAVDYGADYAVENDSPSSSFTTSLPKLVTSDDVRANIQYTPSEAPETADASQATRPNRDFGALREDSHRSPGVNSLFEPSSAARPAASALHGRLCANHGSDSCARIAFWRRPRGAASGAYRDHRQA